MSRRGTARSKLWQRSKVRSGFEKRLKDKLEALGIEFGYETETFEYIVKRKYKPDFVVEKKNGKKVYIEAKGRLDGDSKQKLKAMKEQYPDKDLRILFQRDQPIRKGSKTYYTEWAKKLGYICEVGEEIPKGWLK